MTKRILVTGGAGFLGSHLCERLLGDGQEVICLDNLYTGSTDNIAEMMDDPAFRFLEVDVNHRERLGADTLGELDAVYHLACPASPVHYMKDAVRTIKTCVFGTLNMLEICREQGARLLVASTSEVYGDPDPRFHPQPESYWGNVNPIGPRSCYDEGKRCSESLAVSFSRQHGVSLRLPRIFNTYGPRMHIDDGRVVSNFVVQALRGAPLTIYGDGSQTRSFCYVSDLVEGFVRLMDSDLQATPVNLGNPGEFTIAELAEIVLRLTGSKAEVQHLGLPQDDPTRRKPDISRAREALNWEPSIPLEQGLKSTIAYFEGRLQEDGIAQ